MVTAARRRVSGRTAEVNDMFVVEIAGNFFVWWDITNVAKCFDREVCAGMYVAMVPRTLGCLGAAFSDPVP